MTGINKKIIICKPDLDTCLTGLILHGISNTLRVHVVTGAASQEQLNDSNVFCIECGGSGNVICNNFDHHDPFLDLPPACTQAWNAIGKNPSFERLVAYVSIIDNATGFSDNVSFPTLSHIFSGMLLTVCDNRERYFAGLSILQDVVCLRLDPFGQMPNLPQWRLYRESKKKHRELVSKSLEQVQIFFSLMGKKVGFLESSLVGGLQGMYGKGCDIAIACNPEFGTSVVRKYTIASQEHAMSDLLPMLNFLEKGWGGRRKIIGSPYTGSRLSADEVVELVRKSF